MDMQNDFVDGSLGTKEAQEIVSSVVEKVQDAREEETDIIFTRDTHQADYLQTQEGKKLPVEHCIQGTHGWEIIDALKPYVLKKIDKPTFGSTELAEIAKKMNCTTSGVRWNFQEMIAKAGYSCKEDLIAAALESKLIVTTLKFSGLTI